MRISIVGCGNMGTAYARSFRKYGLVKDFAQWGLADTLDSAITAASDRATVLSGS